MNTQRAPLEAKHINQIIASENVITNDVSDGYHTFGELYNHRIALWIALCNQVWKDPRAPVVWRSERHSDGELAFGGGWFVLGIGNQNGSQITYHLPMIYWDQCSFAATLDKAPEWDGHTSADVLQRIKNL